MRRSVLNFLVDGLTFLVLLGMAATGLVIRFALPPGTGGRRGHGGLALWGLDRHDWGGVHFWMSAALGVLVAVHVALHWTWVCAVAAGVLRGPRARAPTGLWLHACGAGLVLAVIVLLGGFTWYARQAVRPVRGGAEWQAPAESSPEDPSGGEPRRGRGRMRGRGRTGDPSAGGAARPGPVLGVSSAPRWAAARGGRSEAVGGAQAWKSITATRDQPSLYRLTYSRWSGWSA